MGKAGYLPDISGRFSQWTNTALKCLQAKNYSGARGALDNMNGLLDEKHRITISTEEYKKKIHEDKFFICNFCTESVKETIDKGLDTEHINTETRGSEIPYSDVHVFRQQNQFLDTILIHKKSSKVWICPKCNAINKLSTTNIIKTERENPFYVQVIPDPPPRSLENSIGYDQKFREYFNLYAKELENALMNYRVDYIKEHGEDMSDMPFVDKGDD